jgi:hypothetical protein
MCQWHVCLAINVSCLFSWSGVTQVKSKSSEVNNTSMIDDQKCPFLAKPGCCVCKCSSSHLRTFDKTETPLAAVQAREGKRKPRLSSFFHFVVRGLLGPLMAVFGVREDRTGGLGPAERKEHYLTAAPFHRFDGDKADWR